MPLDLVVTETTLPEFLEDTATTQATEIRALTVRIDYDQLVSPNQICQRSYSTSIHDSRVAQALWNHLRNLARALQHMTGLITFALVVTHPKCTFWLPRDIVTDLVKSLPLQCCNLEIDTAALDRVREDEEPNEHLCTAISNAIAQLTHLRLRLTAICPALFNANSALGLETVSVNCVGGSTHSSGAQLCNSHAVNPLMVYHESGNDAAPAVAQSLHAFATRHCPALKLATVTSVTPNDYDDRSTHPSYDIRDGVANKTYALPFIDIWGLEDGNTLLRARNGEESISDRATIALLAEGQVWKATTTGLRLPASMLLAESSPYTAREMHLLTVEEWKEQNPKRSCALWANEKKTGRRLIDATLFEGLTEHVPLKEDTPEGVCAV